jgi:hypothetical protein
VGVGGASKGYVRSRGKKPPITHRIVAIEFGLGVLLALNFNGDKFLCVFFWVHNGWRLSAGDVLHGRLSAGDVLLGGPSII